MSLLDSFIHGNALTEILIEGHNPCARLKLSTEAADALRQHIHAPDTLLAFVAGREVMSGAGIWAVTQGKFLIHHQAAQTVTALDLSQITLFEAVRGKYGHTVRVSAQGKNWAMYGADKDLAENMHQALSARGIRANFEDKPPRGTLWAAYSGPLPSPEHCLSDARQRLAV
jgi:hypothetical protein